nr:MAG: putative RNA-dependent RNA polymerase [Carmotetraviridae sp.]
MCKGEVTTHPHIRIPERRTPCREQTMLVAKLLEPFLQLQIPAQCLCNETLGVANRVLGVRPEMSPLLECLMRQQLRLMVVRAGPYDTQTLLSRCPDGKRKPYEKALISLLDAPLTSEDKSVKAFVKMEKLELLKPEKFKDPRIIQARTPRFNVMLGMYTRAIEDHLKGMIDPEWQALGVRVEVIAKGHNLQRRAQQLLAIWGLYDQPASVSMDLSRWDMHVSAQMLWCLGEYYQLIFPSPLLAELLEPLTNSSCKTTKGVKYTKKHGVTSGDMTTALGNCVAVIAITWALRKELSDCVATGESLRQRMTHQIPGGYCDDSNCYPETELLCKPCLISKYISELAIVIHANKLVDIPPFTIYDDGDDHVMITDKRLVPTLNKLLPVWWEEAGHKLTTEPPALKPEAIEFCQMRVLPTIPVMVPDPKKVIPSSLCLTGRYREQWKEYLKTVWKARAIMHQGVPVLGPLFYHLQKELRGPLLKDMELRHALMRQNYWLKMTTKQLTEDLKYVEPSPQSREWMRHAWGVDQETQLSWERLRVKDPGVHITHLDIWNQPI